MRIAIGTDHRGFMHKEYIKAHCREYEWVDVGTDSTQRTDYPLYAQPVIDLMKEGEVSYGVLLCSTGIGMAIAANRNEHIYAAVVWNEEITRQAKSEDNMNVLVIPSDFVSCEKSVSLIHVWLSTEFKGNRYAQRLEMIDKK